ncbi:hypothetical protein PoHVEF18_009202 [Penicillium ochrochloron]
MALLTTPTYRDVLRNDLEDVLKEYSPGARIKLQCLATNKAYQNPRCGCTIGQEHIVKIQALLDRPITYLEGDKDKISAVLKELASLCIHRGNNHQERGPKKVQELVKKYRETVTQHLETQKREGNVMAVSELATMPEEIFVEEETLPITQPSCAEVTMAIKVEEVTYPALPTTHTFVMEDKEEIAAGDSSNESHPLLQHQNDTQSRPLTNPSTPLPSKAAIQQSNPISNTFPSNPMLSLILNFLQQLFVGFISLVQVEWGHVPVETTSGEIKNKSVVDLKVLLGMRMVTELVPAG